MAGSSPGFHALNMACSFTLTPGPDVTICNPGQSVNIGATVTGQYLSAVWTPSTGLSNPNALNTSATVSQTTTYTLTVSGLSASNLIVNGDFSAGLTGFTSDYVQGTGGSFGLLSLEGTFAVSTNANLTHNNFVNCTDHTGGGNMLVVNGAGTPNQNVWCQTVMVSPGTNYAFSLWGATVVASSPAILQFSINGNLLGSSFSLPTATCQWTQHFQLWNSGGASSATICIVNQNTQTSGNDFALDDIVFGPVCEETTQVTVTVIDVDATWTPPQGLCPLSPGFPLNSLLSPTATPGGAWTINGSPATFFNPALLGPGTFSVSYTVGTAPCIETVTLPIVVNTLPSADWLTPGLMCVGMPAVLLNNLLLPGALPGGSWTINGSPAFVFNPSVWGPGSHTVIYETGTPPCTNSLAQIIQVQAQPIADWTPPLPLCINSAAFPLNTLLPPGTTPGGTWLIGGNNALVFNPAVQGAGPFSVTYQVGTFPCNASQTHFIEVLALPNAQWDGPDTLCRTAQIVMLNTWLLPGTATGGSWTLDGQAATQLNPALLSPGLHTLVYTVGPANCQRSASGTVRIQDTLSAPEPFCSIVTGNSVEIQWPGMPGQSYTVQVLSGPAPSFVNNTSAQFTGLAVGASVSVILQASAAGPCPPVFSDTLTCTTFSCDALPVHIQPVDTLCLYPGAPAITLTATLPDTAAQGIPAWSGPGITNAVTGQFSPTVAGAGTHTIYFFYNLDNCVGTDSIEIVVVQRPTAMFSVAPIVCIADTTVVTFTGMAGPSATYLWDFDDAQVLYGSGPGPIGLLWDSYGQHLISLTVEESGCVSLPYFRPVNISAVVDTPQVFCNAALTEIELVWNSLPDGNSVIVYVLDGPLGTPTSDTSYLITGLMPGQQVTVRMSAGTESACDEVIIIVQCDALPCTGLAVDIAQPDTVCLPAGPLDLDAVVTGGGSQGQLVWSGPGITDTLAGTWQPNAGMIGQLVPVTATFTEGPCSAADTVWIAVSKTPTSDISADSVVCVADAATVQYLGNAGAGAVFNWNFGGAMAVPGNGAGPQSLSFASAGNYMITLSVEENGCAGAPDTALIQVDALLQMPVVQCEATYTSVIFSWASQANAAQHSVLNLSGNGGAMQGDTAFVVTGLMPGQTVNIELTAHSANACPDATAAATCTTLPCPDVQIDIAPVPAVCWDGQADTIALSAQLSGAPATGVLRWEGEGVADTALGTWVSAANMAGRSITVYAVFTDDVCVFRDSASIAVWPVPTSDISADSVVCVADMATVQYLGNAGAGAVFNWNFGGATAVPGNGAGPQSLSFASAGNYMITLSVEENGCAGAPDTALIQVDALLQMPVVQCEATYTSVIFSWASQANAAQHSVLNLSGNGGAMQGDTAFVVTGLMPGQTVNIELTAHSANACPDATAAATCTTLPCPDVQIDIAPVPAVCWDGQADTIALSAQLSGAPATGVLRWEGEGVADTALGTWVSAANMAGRSITVYAVFTDDVCVFRDSASIAVWPVPTSDISADSVVCVADMATVQYLGNAGAGAVFNWNFGGATAVPGNGAGPQSLSFASAGNYMITLSVEENGCAGAPDTALIQVDALLQMPVVQCETTYTSVVFSWPAIVGATAYQVILPAGIIPVWTSDTSIIISNLAPGTTLPISVEAVSETACPNTSAQSSCTTLPCPPVSLTMTATPVVCIGDSAQVQFSLAGPAGTLLDLVLSDGVQTWPLAGVGHGRIFRFLPAQSLVINVISAANAALPACPVNLPAPVQVQVEALREAGTPIMGAPVCAFTDTLVNLNQLLMGADGGGQWSLFPGSAQPFAGSFQAGAGSFRVTPNDAGSFRFRYIVAAGAACPADTAVASLELLPLPPANAGPDQTLDCLHRVVSIGRAGNAAFRYLWTSADGRLIDDDMPIVEADAPGLYRLEVLNPLTGCRAFDEMRVISEIAVLEPQTGVGQISCYGADDGWIQVQAVGQATPPLQFSLNGAPPVPQGLFPRLSPGLYELLIRDAAGCETTLRFDLQQPSELQAVIDAPGLAGDPPSIQLGDSLRLELLTNVPPAEVASIVWSPAPCPECMSVSLRPSFTDTYAVTVTNQNGCSASAELTVLVDRRPAVFIPNAFSPNNDGFNDRLLVFAGKQVSHVRSFLIFDRWGEAVYEVYQFPPNDPAYGWDGSYRGQPLQSAVFVYVAEVETIDGEVHLLKGDVTLVR